MPTSAPPPLTPAERRLRSQIANAARWGRTDAAGRRAGTEAARAALWQRYLDRVDPGRVLPEAERARLARQARTGDMARLSLTASRKAAAARERRAVAEHPCPVCGRPAGKPCGTRRPRNHPHPERLGLLDGEARA